MNIVIIRPGALGDTLMLAPAFAEMKGREDIDLIARTPGLGILRAFVRKGLDYEKGGWHRLFMDAPFPPRDSMSGNHGKPYPWMGADQNAGGSIDLAVVFLSDKSGKVRGNLEVLMPGTSIHVFPPFPTKGEKVHTALYLAECMESSGCPVNSAKAIEEAVQRPLLRGGALAVPGSGKKIVFHPGSGGVAKNHPREFWAALVRGFRCAVTEKAPLVILLGPAEEPWLSFYLEQFRSHDAEIVFSPEMDPLLGLLKDAPLYIGHDSGITHLAAMLGTPTLALFRNSSIEQWEPLGPRVRVIKGRNCSDLTAEVYEKAREMVP